MVVMRFILSIVVFPLAAVGIEAIVFHTIGLCWDRPYIILGYVSCGVMGILGSRFMFDKE